jgi:hypothetical protein
MNTTFTLLSFTNVLVTNDIIAGAKDGNATLGNVPRCLKFFLKWAILFLRQFTPASAAVA